MADSKPDEREARLLNDPRRDPTDPPPPLDEREETGRDAKVEAKEDGGPKRGESDAPTRGSMSEPPTAKEPPTVAVAPAAQEPVGITTSAGGGSVVTAVDPRILELEPLVAAADWDGVAKLLGKGEGAERLPPNLGLLYALARKETGVAKGEDYEPNVAAIRCMAGLLAIPKESPIALVLGKRLLRSNPVSWQKAPAPPASISLFIVALGLLIGAGIGWLLSFGYVSFRLPSLPFFH